MNPGPAVDDGRVGAELVRVGRAWTARFGLIWLGLWAAQLAPIQLLLPLQLADADPVHKVRDFGLVNGAAGIAALVALPVFGALCDRTRSRFGRRRVWVAAGQAGEHVAEAVAVTRPPDPCAHRHPPSAQDDAEERIVLDHRR